MTALSTVPSPGAMHAALPGDLLDALCEAVTAPADPGARSAIICTLLQEVCDDLEWRHAGVEDADVATQEELASVRQLAAAAHRHHVRMAALSSSPAEEHAS